MNKLQIGQADLEKIKEEHLFKTRNNNYEPSYECIKYNHVILEIPFS